MLKSVILHPQDRGDMHRIDFDCEKDISLGDFLDSFKCEDFQCESVDSDGSSDEIIKLYRVGKSSTPFVLVHYSEENQYSIFMEKLASYEDYSFFPILASRLSDVLFDGQEDTFGDLQTLCSGSWIEESISDEIAYLKAVLSAGYPYMFSFGTEQDLYVDVNTLRQFGVGLTSSTPRIYGYIQYALKHNMLGSCDNLSDDYPDIEVDVPAHISVGRVKSWQTDGSKTWESYSSDDVVMLVEIGNAHIKGEVKAEGVTLNDLATLYQEGVGVPQDYVKAAFWYGKAIDAGDLLYAPSNLGDTYRKGGHGLPRDLHKALDAYMLGQDPYAHYRIGQAYEEGWLGRPELVKAFEWYAKAAQEGHHLAIKRLTCNRVIS